MLSHQFLNPPPKLTFIDHLRGVWALFVLFFVVGPISLPILFNNRIGKYFYSYQTKVQINIYFSHLVWSFFISWIEREGNVKMCFRGLEELESLPAVFMMSNHQHALDIFALLSLAYRKNRMGACRFFAKKSLSFVPFFGWAMWSGDFLMLSRDWNKDSQKLHDTFQDFLVEPRSMWLCTFPEGSRLHKESITSLKKLKNAQSFAEEKGEQPLENLLYPRTKGFVSSIQSLRSLLTHVVDTTITYDPLPTSTWAIVCGKANVKINVNIETLPLSELSIDDEGLSNDLKDLFRKKDAFLSKNDAVYTYSEFPQGLKPDTSA